MIQGCKMLLSNFNDYEIWFAIILLLFSLLKSRKFGTFSGFIVSTVEAWWCCFLFPVSCFFFLNYVHAVKVQDIIENTNATNKETLKNLFIISSYSASCLTLKIIMKNKNESLCLKKIFKWPFTISEKLEVALMDTSFNHCC